MTGRVAGPTPTTHDAAGAAIAWVESMNAFYRAALADRPEDPAFLATLVAGGPVYTHSVGFVTEIATAGAEGPGSWHVGAARVLAETRASAIVTGCSWDAGTRWRRSGTSAPASLGGGAGYTATRAVLVWRGSRWLVSQADTTQTTPSEVGPCHAF